MNICGIISRLTCACLTRQHTPKITPNNTPSPLFPSIDNIVTPDDNKFSPAHLQPSPALIQNLRQVDLQKQGKEELLKRMEKINFLVEKNNHLLVKIDFSLETMILSKDYENRVKLKLKNYSTILSEFRITEDKEYLKIISEINSYQDSVDNEITSIMVGIFESRILFEIQNFLNYCKHLSLNLKKIDKYSDSAHLLLLEKVHKKWTLKRKAISPEEHLEKIAILMDYIKKITDLVRSIKYYVYQNILKEFNCYCGFPGDRTIQKDSSPEIQECKKHIKEIVKSLGDLNLKSFENYITLAITAISNLPSKKTAIIPD